MVVRLQTPMAVTKTSPKKKSPPEDKKKKRAVVKKSLSPATKRVRQVNHLARRIAKEDVVTPAFLTAALKSHRKAAAIVGSMADKISILERQRKAEVEKAKDDAKKVDRVNTKYEEKVKRCNRIKAKFEAGPKLKIPPADHVFLDAIRTPRPMTAYMFYAKRNRETFISKNPKATFGEIGRIIGKNWSGLTDSERQEWKQWAMEDYRKNNVVV